MSAVSPMFMPPTMISLRVAGLSIVPTAFVVAHVEQLKLIPFLVSLSDCPGAPGVGTPKDTGLALSTWAVALAVVYAVLKCGLSAPNVTLVASKQSNEEG